MKKTYDVTGFQRVKKGQAFDRSSNGQRFAVVSMYKLLISRGVSPEEAAKDCGYHLSTLKNWTRLFSEPPKV